MNHPPADDRRRDPHQQRKEDEKLLDRGHLQPVDEQLGRHLARSQGQRDGQLAAPPLSRNDHQLLTIGHKGGARQRNIPVADRIAELACRNPDRSPAAHHSSAHVDRVPCRGYPQAEIARSHPDIARRGHVADGAGRNSILVRQGEFAADGGGDGQDSLCFGAGVGSPSSQGGIGGQSNGQRVATDQRIHRLVRDHRLFASAADARGARHVEAALGRPGAGDPDRKQREADDQQDFRRRRQAREGI